jgi:hypothetical protein
MLWLQLNLKAAIEVCSNLEPLIKWKTIAQVRKAVFSSELPHLGVAGEGVEPSSLWSSAKCSTVCKLFSSGRDCLPIYCSVQVRKAFFLSWQVSRFIRRLQKAVANSGS